MRLSYLEAPPQKLMERHPESPDGTACPECGGKIIWTENEAACRGCGLVIEPSLLDRSGGQNQADSFETDGPSGLQDIRMGSHLFSNHSSPRGLRRLSSVNLWSRGARYCRLSRFSRLAYMLGDKLGVSDLTCEAALLLLESAARKAEGKRANVLALLGAAFIIASRKLEAGKVVCASDIRRSLDSLGFSMRPGHILDSLSSYKDIGLYVASTPPIDCVDEIFSRIDWTSPTHGLPPRERYEFLEELKRNARNLLSLIDLREIGSNPRALASCAIYVSWRIAARSRQLSKRDISHAFMARISGLAEYTIRENYERHFRQLLVAAEIRPRIDE